MKLIVGLGNPGKRYDGTRHNIGAAVLDHIASSLSAGYALVGTWKSRFQSLCLEAKAGSHSLLLLKPQTFMNRSGQAVQEAATFYKLSVGDLIVLQDDIDLNFGDLRLRQGGGEGGHNGLRSISAELGSSDYLRLKIGVGRPPIPEGVPPEGRHNIVSDWVLSSFSADEQRVVGELCARAAGALKCLIESGLKAAQQAHHGAK